MQSVISNGLQFLSNRPSTVYVTLDHKTSFKSHGIFVAIAKNTLYVQCYRYEMIQNYRFFFYAKNH